MPEVTKRNVIASLLKAKRKGIQLTSRGNRMLADREVAKMGRTLANLDKKGKLTPRGKRRLAELRQQGLAPK